MDPQRFLCWRVLLLLLSTSRGLLVSVHILNEQPVYVIPGSSLVLRARVDPGPPQAPPAVTWEREPESGAAGARETLATCPGGSGGCAGARPGVRAGVEQLEATLQVSGYGRADGGVYVVTVRDREGATATARCIVREYEAVHHVSIGVNASHSALV
ncbi:uncharacterized protein si:dkeyp-97a10.2 [Betta splendens]|uniref:Uncharacterized protein si:dkeyp-97a10.2 n=1 Tax=Betta splendens TaxID=158456 RepID=A0A9W2XAX4_BETSP|nr:uncharacterized protein si:dkeyp-97a10.2 [Betta splendens]XP_055358859.1 uncharacterized protein si:dkeyp-97a10.2 [Betta splendens]XP_055358860.1 uncharacterized protein si:dkeyp-97a10.2 [Betta splendens]XP_055358861.1 uncharacterized protein si:dkeyp-97a10.2 [Betta splendens]XP_055358862.1 uncharacterized protein si:dkeyp-97a10.2 [Betta splendens]